jgi:hypothetical protein
VGLGPGLVDAGAHLLEPAFEGEDAMRIGAHGFVIYRKFIGVPAIAARRSGRNPDPW